ncbi:DUF3794 domain-containing protein, partial [Romboutsia sp.]|uniref:DUF3794 domain-containing protein n=1 Tax=Romboutsia sp. TaxID=1965302 RepID=UPI002C5A5F90
ESNEVVTYVEVRIFKQLSVDTNVKIPPQKPEAEDIIEITACVDITYTYLIKTPVVTSYEGQELTGWKLIVEGIIRQKVVYIANEPTQSVHAAEFEIPFSTFVILPKDYKPCSDVRVTGYIEDDFAKLLSDRRTIFKNITLMIEGRTGC